MAAFPLWPSVTGATIAPPSYNPGNILIKDIPLLKDFLVKSENYTPSYAVVRINNDIDCTSYSHPIGIIKFFDTEEMADAFCETLEELKSSECFYMVVPFLGELPQIHHATSRAESNKKDCFLA